MTDEEARLRRELEEARVRYRAALAEQRNAEQICNAVGAGHADGTQALQNANQVLSSATTEFRRALRNFTDAVLHFRPRQGGGPA